VEALQDHLGGLLRERERLHEVGNELDLERNRRDIVLAQWGLTHALLARHAAG
jgi:hypothetical protein